MRLARLSSQARVFLIMCMANRLAHRLFETVAIEHHFAVVNAMDGCERDAEIACPLDIDDELGPALGSGLPDRTESVLAIVNENVEAFFDASIPMPRPFQKSGTFACGIGRTSYW